MGWSSSKTNSGGGGGGSVNSVTGLNTDNTDPANPVVAIAVDTTLTGAGTPLSPLGVDSNLLLSINPTQKVIPVKTGVNSFGDSLIFSDEVAGIIKTFFLGVDRGISIDYVNLIYQLTDANGQTSVDWYNKFLVDSAFLNSVDWGQRRLVSILGVLPALSFACSREKTESAFYQNDFLARLQSQSNIIANAVLGEIWFSGHTIEALNPPPMSTPLGSILTCKSGNWAIADFTTLDSTNLLGIYVGGNQIFLDGHIVVTGTGVATNFPIVNGQVSLNIGTPIYGDPLLAGNMTILEPSTTNDVSRRLGHAYYEDALSTGYFLMLFRPSNDWTIVP